MTKGEKVLLAVGLLGTVGAIFGFAYASAGEKSREAAAPPPPPPPNGGQVPSGGSGGGGGSSSYPFNPFDPYGTGYELGQRLLGKG